jgi:two-component system, NtrC family, nitrogen regulation response regulator NtrX
MVPPLRSRTEDIPMLTDIFFKEAAQKSSAPKKSLAPESVALLCRYSWPGNVRELKNLAERLVIMVPEESITPDHLPAPYNPQAPADCLQPPDALFEIDKLKAAKQAFEKKFIQFKLHENEHNISKTAKSIGVERSYLHRRIKKLEQEAPE